MFPIVVMSGLTRFCMVWHGCTWFCVVLRCCVWLGVVGHGCTWLHIGPDHVQLTKVNWRLKVNWKIFSTKMRKYLPIHFTSSESCALSKVNWNQRKSIGTHVSQLEFI